MIKGKVRPIHADVLICDMYFGEMKTAGGLYIPSDDAKTHGVKPRWGRVYAKGPENNEDYQVGDWILVEHGRWTRKFKIEDENGDKLEIQKVELEAIIAYQKEKPNDLAYWGKEYNDGEAATIDPSLFVNN